MKMDKGEICTVGTEIKTEKECSEALNFASDLGIEISSEALTKVTVGSWGFLPYQCSYRAGGAQTFFLNHRKTTNAKLFVNGMHNVFAKMVISFTFLFYIIHILIIEHLGYLKFFLKDA